MDENNLYTFGHRPDCKEREYFSKYIGRDDLGYYWECASCGGCIGPIEDWSPNEAYGEYED